LFLTSDIDISSRWIPSKHFQVTDIFNFKLVCFKKNAILSIFWNDSKKLWRPETKHCRQSVRSVIWKKRFWIWKILII